MTDGALKTKDIKIQNKIAEISNLGKKTDLITKAAELENKVRDINNLGTMPILDTKATMIENKIPNVTNSVKKVALNTKTTEIKKSQCYSRFYYQIWRLKLIRNRSPLKRLRRLI